MAGRNGKFEIPFSQFNYIVDIGNGDAENAKGGFQEVSGLGMEINVAEYRAGNSKVNAPQKIPGTYKVTDVTLKRGVLGSDDLFSWIVQVRSGGGLEGETGFGRTVTIQLLSEDRAPVVTWTLTNAFPTKYVAPSLNAKGTDIAIEELTLACETIEMELE